MELTGREKEMLVMFGCFNRKWTHERLGVACMLIMEPVSKAAACSLRNKLHAIGNDRRYIKLYCRVLEELNNYSGDAA